MKILNGGKKDYYDYLVGIYGIDEDIVYDRREGQPFVDNWNRGDDLRKLFGKTRLYQDSPKSLKSFYDYELRKRVEREVGDEHYCILEVGYFQYYFKVERWIDENGRIIIEPKLIKKYDKGVHFGKTPVTLYIDSWATRSYFYFNAYEWDHVKRSIEQLQEKDKGISDFLLNGTWLTSFIPADEMYNNVYDYLISIREKKIEDNRNDIQKLESKGFDKKISFRHPVNKRRK